MLIGSQIRQFLYDQATIEASEPTIGWFYQYWKLFLNPYGHEIFKEYMQSSIVKNIS